MNMSRALLPPTHKNHSAQVLALRSGSPPAPHALLSSPPLAGMDLDAQQSESRDEDKNIAVEPAQTAAPLHHGGGTELFTITERSSVTTMKTLPFNATFQRHIISAQQRHVPAGQIGVDDKRDSLRRRECFSLEEQIGHKLHQDSDV